MNGRSRTQKILTILWFILGLIFLTIGSLLLSEMKYDLPSSVEASSYVGMAAVFIAWFTIFIVFLIICGVLSFILSYASFKGKKWISNKKGLFSSIFLFTSIIFIVMGALFSEHIFYNILKWIGVITLFIDIAIIVLLKKME